MKEKENCALRPPKSAKGGKRKLTANHNEQWEYKIISNSSARIDFIERELNRLGAEGWEVYSVKEYSSFTEFFLKRRAQKGGSL